MGPRSKASSMSPGYIPPLLNTAHGYIHGYIHDYTHGYIQATYTATYTASLVVSRMECICRTVVISS
jgi:hypothetical protein